MLSRVANQIYWLARYLERAEDTARMLGAFHMVQLDLPGSERLDWTDLVRISGAETVFANRYRRHDERNVVTFILADRQHHGSVLTSIASARENLRTTREMFPSEIWEAVNGLHHYASAECAGAATRRRRHEVLTGIIERCQLILGMMTGTLSRDDAYRFLTLGYHIERIDMTTRILDVGAQALAESEAAGSRELVIPKRSALWQNIVRAVNAEQMFRRRRLPVNHTAVIDFLLHDPAFPRSVGRCLEAVRLSMSRLPRDRAPRMALRRFAKGVQEFRVEDKTLQALHEDLDQMQLGVARLHNRVAKTWFRPALD